MSALITLNKIKARNPCEDGWKKLLTYQCKTKSDDEEFPLADVLKSNGFDDALWCVRCLPEHNKKWRLLAVKFARQAQHLMTDQRSIQALDIAEKHARGDASDDELKAAADAAWAGEAAARAAAARAVARAAWAGEAAAWVGDKAADRAAARAAAKAAEAAAWAARAADRAADRAAAWAADAAWAAASRAADAAWAAASRAAEAAWAAAYAAYAAASDDELEAADAAWAAARAKQKQLFLEVLGGVQ